MAHISLETVVLLDKSMLKLATAFKHAYNSIDATVEESWAVKDNEGANQC